MNTLGLIILLACILYSLLSKTIARTILTLPILFTGLGFVLSGPLTAHVPEILVHDGKALLAEVTLVLVLFSDASRVRLRRLAMTWQLPARLLFIGMPLTLALGTLVAFWLNPLSGLATALLTAAVLTPTDAALGQAVVTNADVPEHLRQTINVESGLNDGLALPFVLWGAIFASAGFGATDTGALATEALTEVLLGPLAGGAVGWTAARAMDWAQDRDLMEEAAGAVIFLVTAFAAYALATAVHGNGFIAAFVAGMAFGNTYRHNIHFIAEFMEGAGQLLTMTAFLVFGAFLLPQGLSHATGTTFVLALLFLSVVRMGPIFLSLTASGLSTREKLFLGWFGPRGLASILFTLLMLDQFEISGDEELLACVSLTVGLSILMHGITSHPLAVRMGRMQHEEGRG